MEEQQQQQMNSGLTRYRSAPSSYFADLISSGGYGVGGGEVCNQFLNPRASSPDSDRFFSRFMSTCGGEDSNSSNFEPVQSQIVQQMKHEQDLLHTPQQQQQQQMLYQSQLQLDHNKQVGFKQDNLYNVASCIGGGGGSNLNLVRHSSMPAGLFAQINVDNAGYGAMRGMGNFGAGGANAEPPFPSASRLKNQTNFRPLPPSPSGMMPHASDTGSKTMAVGSPETGSFGESRRNDAGYATALFPTTSWDDSALLSDDFLKGFVEDDRKTFSSINSQENYNGEGGTRTPTGLAHHLSLPTSSAELSAMEKLLQFPDSVPLRIRAKRGCATHPRSIAERVRRTKISERMRKLQELVPNMDKQTNTSDMLDLAVDYIKDLQKQVKTLSDVREKCTCTNKQKT